MRATTFNHVGVAARSLDESLAFYTGIFGMEQIPSPAFRQPAAWLRLGDHELHLFQRDSAAPRVQHFALNVDDFEAVYVTAKTLDILDWNTWGSHIY